MSFQKLFFSFLVSLAAVAVQAQGTLNVGYVTDDDALQIIDAQPQGVCSLIGQDILTKYAGSAIVGMRISLGSTAVNSVRAFVSADPNPNKPAQDVASYTLSGENVVEGWNQVTFATPYVIKGTEEELYMGYYVDYPSTESRPIMVNTTERTYGLLAYTNDTYGLGWYDYSSSGTLAVQLVLSGGNLPDYDPAVVGFATDARYYKSDATEMRIRFFVENHGMKALPGVTLDLTVDETPVGQLVIDEEITGSSMVNQALSLQDLGLAAGQHTFTIKILSVKDATITPGTEADDQTTTSFQIYTNSLTRTGQLMEVYVSQQSRSIPAVQEAVAALVKSKPAVIPVFIHTDLLDSQSDVLALPQAADLGERFGLFDVPAMTFNRVVVSGYANMLLQPDTGESAVANMSGLLDYIDAGTPSFATVSIKSATYNEATNQLVITVTGKRGGDYLNIFGDGAVTLYLTEDQVMADQTLADGSVATFAHDYVLRHIATATFGDAVAWNSPMSFTKEYTISVDPSWNLSNMHAVAFLGKTITDGTLLDNCDVTNAATFALSTILPDAVTSVAAPAPVATPWYDLSGRQVSHQTSAFSPQLPRGLYIHNGQKVVVK